MDGGVVSIDDDNLADDLAANGFSLGNNFPDPFTSTTSISYTLPRAEIVELTLFDITGRLIKTLVNKVQQAGTHTINWNASSEQAGVYFYKIKAGNFTAVKKCVLQK